MTYSYSTPVTYGPQVQPYTQPVYEERRQPSVAIPVTVAGAVVGGGAGAAVGACMNPYFDKNNAVKDYFAQETYMNYLETATDAEKTLYNQSKAVLKDLNNAKDTKELKTLLDSNKEVKKLLDKDFVAGMNDSNLSANKTVIINKIENAYNEQITKIKNDISRCWDKEKKKWNRPADVTENKYKAIEKTTKKIKWTNIGKGAGIGAAALGLSALAAYGIYKHQKNSVNQ